MQIVTSRLVMRRARPEDLASLHVIFSDPRAMRYWSTPPHESVEVTRTFLDGMIHASPDRSDDFIVERTGQVIGKAGCWRIPEIGYILHPAHWGQGLAQEALRAVIGHIFATHEIPGVTADVDPRNGASLRLLRRLGFEEMGRASGTYEVVGEVSDSVYFTLRRPPSPVT